MSASPLALPDLVLHVASFLDRVDLASLSLASKALHELLRPRLLNAFTLGWYRWPMDNWVPDVVVRRELDELLADSGRLELLRELTLFNHEKWMRDRGTMERVIELVEKTKLVVLEVVQAESTVDEMPIPLSICDLQKAFTRVPTIRILRLSWHRGPLFDLDAMPGVKEFLLGPYHIDYVHVWPPLLRKLTLNAVGAERDDDEVFPHAVFEALESLSVISCSRHLLRKLYTAFKTYLDDRSTPPPPLKYFRLDLFDSWNHSPIFTLSDPSGKLVHFRDLSLLFRLFSAAPAIKSLTISSTPTLDHARETFDWRGSSQIIYTRNDGTSFTKPAPDHGLGLDGQPVADVTAVDGVPELLERVKTLVASFPRLEQLTLQVGPSGKDFVPLAEDTLVRLALALKRLTRLKYLTTNLLLDDAVPSRFSAAFTGSSARVFGTIQLLLWPLPRLTLLTLSSDAWHPALLWLEPAMRRDQPVRTPMSFAQPKEPVSLRVAPAEWDEEGEVVAWRFA
ncbi:hypothetical protein JCM8097_009497 [Rhodosporidiobolus ruineniae]